MKAMKDNPLQVTSEQSPLRSSVNIEDIGDFSPYISEEPTLIDIRVLVLGFVFDSDCADLRYIKMEDRCDKLNTCNMVREGTHDPFISPTMCRIEVENPLPRTLERYGIVFLSIAHTFLLLIEGNDCFYSLSEEKML